MIASVGTEQMPYTEAYVGTLESVVALTQQVPVVLCR